MRDEDGLALPKLWSLSAFEIWDGRRPYTPLVLPEVSFAPEDEFDWQEGRCPLP
jgi:hypothetical protein